MTARHGGTRVAVAFAAAAKRRNAAGGNDGNAAPADAIDAELHNATRSYPLGERESFWHDTTSGFSSRCSGAR